MAIKIDNDLLQQLGLAGLPDAEKNSLLRHIYETLEMRVGMRLADQMTNEQLDEFEQYFDAKDDAGAFKWLEANFPNYKQIVQEEFDKLKSEIGQSAPQILAASQQTAAQAPQAVAEPQQQPQPQVAPQAPAPEFPVAPAPAPAAAPQAPAQPQVVSPPAPAPAPAQQFQAMPPQAPVMPQQQQPTVTPGPGYQPTTPPVQTQRPQQPDFPMQQPPAGPASQPPTQQ